MSGFLNGLHNSSVVGFSNSLCQQEFVRTVMHRHTCNPLGFHGEILGQTKIANVTTEKPNLVFRLETCFLVLRKLHPVAVDIPDPLSRFGAMAHFRRISWTILGLLLARRTSRTRDPQHVTPR